jgi:hypothetical protein
MNAFQRKLRMIIVAGSAVGFLGGWGLLAHSGKPAATQSVPAITLPATLPPIDFNALESSTGSAPSFQSLPIAPAAPSFSRPMFRTGGS